MHACHLSRLRLTLLLATALLSGVSMTASAVTFPGPQLIDEPVQVQNFERRSNFSMARAADGRAIAAWSEDSLLKLQRISNTGQASGQVAQLNVDTGQPIISISSAMDNSGRYTVAYAKSDVFLRRFEADGTARDTDWISAGSVVYASIDDGVTAPVCDGAGQLDWENSEPQVAMNASGHTAVIWQRIGYCGSLSGRQAVDYRVYLREITASGTGMLPQMVYRDERAYGHSAYAPGDNFRIAVASDNSVYFAWRREMKDYAPENIIRPLLLRRYVNGVTPAALTVEANFKRVSTDGNNPYSYQVQGLALAELEDGTLAIVWNNSEPDPEYPWITRRQLRFRLLDHASQTLDATVTVPDNNGQLTGLAVDSDGGFTLSSIGTGSPAPVQHVRYNANGAETGIWYPVGDIHFRNDIHTTYNSPRISNGNYLLLHVIGEIGGGGQVLDNSERTLLIVPYGGPTGTKALYFRANKTQAEPIDVFGDVMLRWATNAEGNCNQYQTWSGQFTAPASNSRQLGYSTAGDRSYQIVCPGGLNKTVTIQVGTGTPTPAPELALTLEPASIDIGGTAHLSWSSSNATSCTASGAWSGARNPNDNESTGAIGTPGTTTYTLVCTGSGGSVTRSVDLDVRGNGTPDAFAFTAASDAEPGSLVVSGSVTISGLSTTSPVSVTGGEYRIDSGSFTTQPGTLQPGQSVQLRTAASTTAGATVTATLTIGGIQGAFSVTTRMPPDASTAVIGDAPGGAVTLTASAGTLANARTVPTPAGAPANRQYPNGFVAFDIEDVPPGGVVTITLNLPAGSNPNAYVKCSADGSSCADFAGATFAGNQVILTLTDNGAGDSNPEPGVISDPGAPAVRPTSSGGGSSSGGALNVWLLLPLLGLAMIRRRRSV